MNITEYKVGAGEFNIYYGKATIKDGFYGIVNADERFYHLVGKKSGFSLKDLLHPDDLDTFLEALTYIEQEPQCMFVRFLTDVDTYRCVYMKISYEGKMIQGVRFFEMEISDIMAITDRYKFVTEQIEKYRRFMSLHDGVFMEYSYETDDLQFYEYFNGQSRRLYYRNLSEAKTELISDDKLSDEQKEEFFVLAEMIQKKISSFKVSIDAQVLADYMKDVRFECNCALLYKDDVHYKMIGLCHHIGKLKPEQPYYMSEYAVDTGTGLLNKKAIQEYALEHILAGKKTGYFILLDVDDFKSVNDRFGHMFGDEVLSKCAEIFRSVTRTRGMVGRFGGDEFMFILDNVPKEEDLRRILKVIEKHAKWAFSEKEGFNISFSIGISKFPDDGTTYEELLKKADKCLYIAKDKGKDRYIIYREQLHDNIKTANDAQRNIGLKSAVSDAEKYILITEMMVKLHKEGKKAIEPVMEEMQTYFDIDGISIYTGKDLHCSYVRGNYVNAIEKVGFINKPGYLELFDANGYYSESHMNRLEVRSALAYQAVIQQEIGKFIQYVLREGGEVKALVSFDFFNRNPKMGITDTGMIQTIGRILAEVAVEG